MSKSPLAGKDVGGSAVLNKATSVGVGRESNGGEVEPRRHSAAAAKRPPSLRSFLKLAKIGPVKYRAPHSGKGTTQSQHLRGVSVRCTVAYASGTNNGAAGANWANYGRYIQRDKACPEKSVFSAEDPSLDARKVLSGWQRENDEKMYQFVLSPDDKGVDLQAFVRDAMAGLERHLGTTLEWCAARHVNTAHPHAHVCVRDRDRDGNPLLVTRKEWHAAISHEARKAATAQLGYRIVTSVDARAATKGQSRKHGRGMEPWMQQSGGVHQLSEQHLQSAQRSYAEWQHRDHYGFIDYVSYVQDKWAGETPGRGRR